MKKLWNILVVSRPDGCIRSAIKKAIQLDGNPVPAFFVNNAFEAGRKLTDDEDKIAGIVVNFGIGESEAMHMLQSIVDNAYLATLPRLALFPKEIPDGLSALRTPYVRYPCPDEELVTGLRDTMFDRVTKWCQK